MYILRPNKISRNIYIYRYMWSEVHLLVLEAFKLKFLEQMLQHCCTPIILHIFDEEMGQIRSL